MDTTRPIIYRSFDANDAALGSDGLMVGSLVQRVRYWGVQGIGYTEKKALSDGRSASDVYLDMRPISIEGVLNSLSRGDLFDRIFALTAAFTPTSAYGESPGDKGFVPLYFYIPTARLAEWPGGEIECFIRARPLAQPEVLFDRDKIGGDDNSPVSIPWSVALTAKDPRIYVVPRVDTVATASGSATLVNRGSYPTPVNATFVIPAAAGSVTITLVGGGADMTLVVPSDPLVRTIHVSSVDHVVTSQLAGGAETLALNLMTQVANTSWPSIPAGGSAAFNWTTTHALSAGSILWYYETFI